MVAFCAAFSLSSCFSLSPSLIACTHVPVTLHLPHISSFPCINANPFSLSPSLHPLLPPSLCHAPSLCPSSFSLPHNEKQMMLTQQESKKLKERHKQHTQELQEWRAGLAKRKQVKQTPFSSITVSCSFFSAL